MENRNLVDNLRAMVRPMLALISGIALIMVSILAWYNETTLPAWLFAVLATPSGAWSIIRTYNKQKTP